MGFSESMKEGAGLVFGLYAGKKMVDWTFKEKHPRKTRKTRRKTTKRK
jgi:hypothetical protein